VYQGKNQGIAKRRRRKRISPAQKQARPLNTPQKLSAQKDFEKEHSSYCKCKFVLLSCAFY
jgi:hypothetical protein